MTLMELLALVLMPPLSVGLVVLGWWLGGHRGEDPAEETAAPAEHSEWLDELTRRRVLVHTTNGLTFDGQLARVDVDGVVLEPCTVEGVGDRLDGRAWVPRDRIGWLQEPTGGGDDR